MQKKIFSVHDSKAEAYLTPIFVKTSGEAIRMFENSCKNKESQFALHPSDFTLCEIGSYNEESAELISLEKPVLLSNASEFVQ